MEIDRHKTAGHPGVETFLDDLYEHFKSVRQDTITHLGKGDALHIIDFHGNNWIDMHSWISSKYVGEEAKQVGFFNFLGSSKRYIGSSFSFITETIQ